MNMDMKHESEQFDQTADYYDLYRPSYPKQVIQQLVEGAHLDKQSKVLEIGAGSGKATELIKDYGFSIKCVEIGESLVQEGRKKFCKDKNITFECTRFEEMQDTGERYDAIMAAQSFHWIPQPVGFEKCALFLKKGGYLALMWNMYLYDDREEHQQLIQLSNKYGGFADFVTMDNAKDRIRTIVNNIEDSGLFFTPRVYQQEWQMDYTAKQYCGFLQTGNRFVQLEEDEKKQAYSDIIHLANQFDGKIHRPYMTVLYMAQKKTEEDSSNLWAR